MTKKEKISSNQFFGCSKNEMGPVITETDLHENRYVIG